MSKILDITGQRFGRLIAISFLHRKNSVTFWKFACDCGNIHEGRSSDVRQGTTKSCGCLRVVKHGKSGTPEHRAWKNMRQRCLNEKRQDYKHYGGRGIKVCERWLDRENGFLNFLEDMRERPSTKHSIDRINNDLGYSKENCRWVTQPTQANNKRNNVVINFNGKDISISEFAKIHNINIETLRSRVKSKDISPREAALLPKNYSQKKYGRFTAQDIARIVNCSRSTVQKHLSGDQKSLNFGYLIDRVFNDLVTCDNLIDI